MFSLADIKVMAQECARQRSGEMSVSDLAHAVYFAHRMMYGEPVSVESIEILGSIVEPRVNARGFRRLPVFIDGRVAGVHADNIRSTLEALCDAYNCGRVSGAEFYQEFESIHPFADGNGRVGFVLYNLGNLGLSGHLQAAPEYIVKN